jgi:hypothetical protein
MIGHLVEMNRQRHNAPITTATGRTTEEWEMPIRNIAMLMTANTLGVHRDSTAGHDLATARTDDCAIK